MPFTDPIKATTLLSDERRLELAMRQADQDNIEGSIPKPGARFSYASVGVPNPYGRGVAAFEPNNVLAKAYGQAKQEADASQLDLSDKTVEIPGSTPLVDGSGKVATMIAAAMKLAARRVPYVWGGTTANGVDCSGLIYYAAQAAGIDMPRYRAKDYGQMGEAVTLEQARPGDVVYYDNPGDTDHVGIYIGGGRVIQAPQSGDVVKVTGVGKATSIRRIFDDSAFGQIALPNGGSQVSYGGSAYDPAVGSYQPGRTAPSLGIGAAIAGSTITRAPAKPLPLSRQPR